jgi:FkbM family methyltransferase
MAMAARLEVWGALAQRDGPRVSTSPDDCRSDLTDHLLSTSGWSATHIPEEIVEGHTDAGSLLLPGRDRFITPLLHESGTWEPEETAFMRSVLRQGMRVIDVGAHVGYHTVWAAKAVGPEGRVISFEATPSNYSLLCANILRNGLFNALPFNVALGRETGTVDLTISPDNTGGNRAYRLHYVEPDFQIPCIALDDVLPDKAEIDLVKVDIEGMDHEAISGMSTMLQRCRPWVITEFNPAMIAYLGDEPPNVVKYYRELGYALRVLGCPDAPSQPADDEIVWLADNHAGGYITLILDPS